MLLALGLPLGKGGTLGGLIGRVDRTNAQQALQPNGIPADRRLEEVPPTVRLMPSTA